MVESIMFGWFPPENQRGLARLIEQHQVKSVIEIGSFLGLSARWFAERVCHIQCVDKFQEFETEYGVNNLCDTLRQLRLPNPFYDLFETNMRAAGAWEKITVRRGWSHEVAHLVEPADLVYVDGDHSYEGCKRDVEMYRPKARKILCGDDYSERFPGVIQAADEIGAQHDGPFWWIDA
jgi:cephalosporin hydroxylase